MYFIALACKGPYSIHEGAVNLGNLHYGFIVVPAASNYIHSSTVCILKIFIVVPCTFNIIHSRFVYQEPKIPDFLIASTTMTKDSALGDSNLVNLTMDSIYYLK